MTDAETIIARVLSEHGATWKPRAFACPACDHVYVHGGAGSFAGFTDPDDIRRRIDQHRAEAAVRALRDAALLPEATTRVEWGSECIDPRCDCDIYEFLPGATPNVATPKRQLVRRTRTTYADHVTEWEPAE